MSLSFQELPQNSETGKLTARLHRLKASLDWASEAIAPAVRDSVLAAIERCEPADLPPLLPRPAEWPCE